MNESVGFPKTYKYLVHQKIKSYAIASIDGIDISDSFGSDTTEYTDLVHLTQSGRAIVANNILESDVFKDAINSCRN